MDPGKVCLVNILRLLTKASPSEVEMCGNNSEYDGGDSGGLAGVADEISAVLLEGLAGVAPDGLAEA